MTHFDLMVVENFFFEICLLKTMENSTRENQRYYIWVCWKNDKGADDIHRELVTAEGSKALSKRTIYRWIEAFEAGQSSIEDAPRSGRPREAVTPSNINIIEDLINNDPHISIESIQEVISISTGSIETILHNEISVKKVCAKWVPHVITDENKRKRVEISRQLLEYLDNGFQNIITGDEAWFHFFTVSSKNDNKVWLRQGENRPQITRTAKNSKKRMFCIFFSVDGIVASVVVEKGHTVTGDYYRNIILPTMFKKFKEISGRSTVRDVMLHHDNAAPHKSKVVTKYLQEERVILLPHPPYSPDLAPCDFFLFPKIKKELGGKWFERIQDLAHAVKLVTDSIPQEEFSECFQSWRRRLRRCIEVKGEYFEGMEQLN